jgi:serine/threonine protein kinase
VGDPLDGSRERRVSAPTARQAARQASYRAPGNDTAPRLCAAGRARPLLRAEVAPHRGVGERSLDLREPSCNVSGTMLAIGSTVGSGWVVTRHLAREPHATGGNFSEGYLAERSAQKGFVKVFDVMRAAGGPDPLRQIEAATKAFNFERDLLAKCKAKNLSHVVVPIEDGVIDRPGGLPLHYIVFEAADGDVRRVLRGQQQLDAAWLLRCIHGICVGISQLHTIEIAHQDLKPSNVLVRAGETKIADLGRACDRNAPAAHDGEVWAGDPQYAPIELHYRYLPQDWLARRVACDVFNIGSMITYMINGANMTLLMLANISSAFRPTAWRGTYPDVAVHLRHALEDTLLKLNCWLHGEDGKEVVGMIRSFCDPMPETRLQLVAGDRNGPLLEWHVSRLDLLSRKAAAGLLRLAP